MSKKYKPAAAVIVLILLVAVIGIVTHVVMKRIPTRQTMDLSEYYGELADGEAALILGDEKLETRALIVGEKVYLPLDVVNTYLNQRYYWDSANQQILYATPSELTSTAAASEAGDQVWLKDGTVYLNLSFVQQYTDMDAYILQNPYRVDIQYQFDNVKTVKVKKNTYVRYQGGIKSPVLTTVQKGTELRLVEELDNWDKVSTDDGFIGYVEKSKVGDPADAVFERNFAGEQYTYLTMDQPVNMVWHQVTSTDANAYFADATANMTGVNVISPTWFYIADTSGNISNIASADYVSQAHEKGLKVWGLIDNFTQDVSTTETLSSTAARQNMISQLVQAALNVGMDGINVDFESLSEDVGIHFLEFLRELSIECHKNNLVLSVDNPVPEDFTSHYDRAEQGKVVDYVIIMGYDEHFAGSYEAGSVASYNYVKEGIEETLRDVPADKVINAVPFYTRLWNETPKTDEERAEDQGTEAASYSMKVTSEALGMEEAAQRVSEAGATVIWDDTVKQNYAEWQGDNDSTYRIWLEDASSLEVKLGLMKDNNLAGTAAWKLGFETSDIWDLIQKYVN